MRSYSNIYPKTPKKGLIVNSAKTNLLVISASKSYQVKAHFYDENSRIDSGPTLKALGFVFNERGDCSTQVECLCTKIRQKIWSLRHLRKAGFNEKELLEVCKTYIRPTVEYSGVIYHSMITLEQRNLIEQQQFFALKKHLWLCILAQTTA